MSFRRIIDSASLLSYRVMRNIQDLPSLEKRKIVSLGILWLTSNFFFSISEKLFVKLMSVKFFKVIKCLCLQIVNLNELENIRFSGASCRCQKSPVKNRYNINST